MHSRPAEPRTPPPNLAERRTPPSHPFGPHPRPAHPVGPHPRPAHPVGRHPRPAHPRKAIAPRSRPAVTAPLALPLLHSLLLLLLLLLLTTGFLVLASSPARASPPNWRWPLDGHPRVLRHFTPPPEPWLAGHRGIDLAASPSARVLAAGPGTIRFAGPVGGKGVVAIDHANGLRTTYLPVTASVKRGQLITSGAEVGLLQPIGHHHCQESCLHWGLIRDSRYVNPLLLLGQAPIRLLPFWPASTSALALPQTALPQTALPQTGLPQTGLSPTTPPRPPAPPRPRSPRTTPPLGHPPPASPHAYAKSSSASPPAPATTAPLVLAIAGALLLTTLYHRHHRHHRREKRQRSSNNAETDNRASVLSPHALG
ncbi:peptidoglycan DD-metalloendopeptidase family protein [Nonomuraea sp. NPDC050783]|uniref:murein hydrolase activator EnvC family protein n=1 Tax=Nonomuraea sp. NPDC050783 TaxID=3154634 RepID=UPI003466F359